jgi:excisionase family DNA binding protein
MSFHQRILLDVPVAAELLSIGKTLMWSEIKAGRIQSVRIGNRVLVPRAAIERLVSEAALAPASAPKRRRGRPRKAAGSATSER